MRATGLLLSLIAVVAFFTPAAHAQKVDEDNIYAEDVEAATDVLSRMERRLVDADSAAQAASEDLPAALTQATRLDRRARRVQAPATRAAIAADRAKAAVVEEREKAAAEVARVRAAERAELAGWRTDRARWIGFAGAALASVLALIAACAVARVRSRASRQRAADIVGLSLAVVVAGSLSALLGALLVADAWTFSWTLVLAVVANTLLWLFAALAGWWRADALSTVGRATAAIAVVLFAGACVPVARAAGQERPERVALEPSVLALASAHADDAGMPTRVTRLERRARRLQDAANAARQRAESAADVRDQLNEDISSAEERAAAAQRSIDRWTVSLAEAQEDYDEYQKLLDFDDDLDEDLNTGDDDIDDDLDLDDFDYDPSFPTTQDFGSGRGSIGMCRDGTFSDSIGRPGACSHHGGVAP